MTKDDEKLLICRVCINEANIEESQDKSYNIFDKYENMNVVFTPGTSRDISIAQKLTACADLKIKKDDGLPNRICSSCLQELEDAYNFRIKCEKSDDILRNAIRTDPDNKYEVPVKEESGTESDNVSDDDASQSHTPHNDLIKPKCEESSSVYDVELDNTDKQQINEDPLTCVNNSVDQKRKNLKLKCPECDHIFKSSCKLRVHQRTEHSKLPMTCPSCKLQYLSVLAFDNHQKSRPKTCVSLSNFRIEGVGVSRHFYCQECEYNTKNVNNAIHHLVVHIKNYKHKCDQCDRSFLRTVTLRSHKERAHKQYYGQKTCHICGKFFRGFTLYDSHMRTHREKRKAQCDICQRMFSSVSSLSTHKKTHSDLRPFLCQKCPAKFRTSAGLNCHKVLTHSEKVYTCKECGYKSKNPYIVKKHESKHDHDNVACSVCGKFLETDTQLALHMKRHEKHHPCDYCDRTYTARKNLTEHMRKAHKIYVSSSDLKGINVKKIKRKIKTDLDQ